MSKKQTKLVCYNIDERCSGPDITSFDHEGSVFRRTYYKRIYRKEIEIYNPAFIYQIINKVFSSRILFASELLQKSKNCGTRHSHTQVLSWNPICCPTTLLFCKRVYCKKSIPFGFSRHRSALSCEAERITAIPNAPDSFRRLFITLRSLMLQQSPGSTPCPWSALPVRHRARTQRPDLAIFKKTRRLYKSRRLPLTAFAQPSRRSS